MYKPWTQKRRFSQNQKPANTSPKLLLVKVPKDGAIALHCLRKRDLQDIGTQALDNLVVNKNMLPTCESSCHTCWCFRNPEKIHHLLPCYLWNPYEKWDMLQMNLCRISSIKLMFLEQPGGEIDPPKVLPCWIFFHSHFPLIGKLDRWCGLNYEPLESNDMGHFLDLPPPRCQWQRKGLVRDSPGRRKNCDNPTGEWHRGSGG